MTLLDPTFLLPGRMMFIVSGNLSISVPCQELKLPKVRGPWIYKFPEETAWRRDFGVMGEQQFLPMTYLIVNPDVEPKALSAWGHTRPEDFGAEGIVVPSLPPYQMVEFALHHLSNREGTPEVMLVANGGEDGLPHVVALMPQVPAAPHGRMVTFSFRLSEAGKSVATVCWHLWRELP